MEVERLNEFQNSGKFHPFTCCSPKETPECQRATKIVDGAIIEEPSYGKLIATENSWVCPCGKYTQNWAYGFMAE